jgi:hypothetical protein
MFANGGLLWAFRLRKLLSDLVLVAHPNVSVTEPRGRTVFDVFEKTSSQFADDPGTMHIQGNYHDYTADPELRKKAGGFDDEELRSRAGEAYREPYES